MAGTREVRAFLFCVVGLLVPFAAQPAAAVEIMELVTPGGIAFWYVREPTLPIIAINVEFENAGASTEPAGKEGLAYLTSVTMDEGAGEMRSLEFLRRAEELGVDYEFDHGYDSFGFEFRTLSERREDVFALVGLMLSAPRFDEEAVGRMRSALVTGLTRNADDPDEMLRAAWLEAAFPGHPYGRSYRGTVETMETLGPDDLREFVATRFTRDRMVVGAVGDVPPEEIARLLDVAFGGLPATGPRFEIPDVRPTAGDVLSLVHLDIPQSTLLFGTSEGVNREDPDFFAASLMNSILGGASFISRLWDAVREERGLAYSVGSYLAGLDHTAYFGGQVATNNARLAETFEVIKAEIGRMVREGVTEQELADVKTYTIGAYAMSLDTNSQLASALVSLQVNDLGSDYIEKRVGFINGVTQEDILRVARRIFLGDPDANPEDVPLQFVTAIVGNPEGFAKAD